MKIRGQRYDFFQKHTNKKLGKNLGFCFFRHKTPQKGKKQKSRKNMTKKKKTRTRLRMSKKYRIFAPDFNMRKYARLN